MGTEGSYDQVLYFIEGRLFIPDKLLTGLVEAGLSHEIADKMRRGLMLAERANLSDLMEAFKQILSRVLTNNARLA